MKIIHKDINRILIGEQKEFGWITIVVVLSNGHVSKLTMPDNLAKVLSDWLVNLKIREFREEEE